MTTESSYNFRQINDRLTTSGLVKADSLKSLGAQGYELVVNLLPDSHEHAVRDERDILEGQGIEYVYIPVDFSQPTRDDFVKFSAALDVAVDKKVHVHCAANYRVSVFCALYEVNQGRWNVEQATDFISQIWKPAEHPAWGRFVDELLPQIKQQ